MNTATTQAAYVARERAKDEQGWLARRNHVRGAWQAKNTEKHNAHNKVYRAVKAGHLVRPESCEHCGQQCKPEASHDDYSRPLHVEWLCRRCHAHKDNARR